MKSGKFWECCCQGQDISSVWELMEVRKILGVLLSGSGYIICLGTHGSQENFESIVVVHNICSISGNSWKSGKFWECCCQGQDISPVWELMEVRKILGVLLLCTTYVPSLGTR